MGAQAESACMRDLGSIIIIMFHVLLIYKEVAIPVFLPPSIYNPIKKQVRWFLALFLWLLYVFQSFG